MSNDANISILSENNRLEWIEPEVRELNVRETQAMPTTGGDGNRMHPDCAAS